MALMHSVPVTNTPKNLSNREIAIAVIADKLGISPADVKDNTLLGDMYHEITMVVTFKINGIIVSNRGMIAADLFRQI